MSVDVDRALHCLEDLGTVKRGCKILMEKNHVNRPTEACEGWSIRDTLFDFLVQASRERAILEGKSRPKKTARVEGQIQALSYSIALMDNPYNPDAEGVRMEAEKAAENE